jgi:uncharacterized membrane protein YwaF
MFQFGTIAEFFISCLAGCIYTCLHLFVNVNLGSNYFHPFSYPVMESDCSYDFVRNCCDACALYFF